MATIAAALYGSADPANVQLTITGLTGQVLFNVYAQAPGEPARPVRGGVSAVPAGDVALLIDTAAPLNRLVTYYLETFAAGTPIGVQVSATPILVPFTPDGVAHHVVSDPITGQSVKLAILASDDQRGNAARAVILEPAGAAYPVVIHDLRRADEGVLPLYTRSRAETAALVALLAAGRPIVSRHDNDGCDIPSVEHVYPLDSSRSRVTRAGTRRWTLPFLDVALPDPYLVVSLVTLQSIADFYTGHTLAAIAADYSTLLELAQDDFGV